MFELKFKYLYWIISGKLASLTAVAFTVLILGAGNTFAQTPPNSIAWTSGVLWHKLDIRLDPTGYEAGQNLYLCRSQVNASRVPGKLWFQTLASSEVVTCHVAYDDHLSEGSVYVVSNNLGYT